jgi:membrane-bound serine protease (ClpP class)
VYPRIPLATDDSMKTKPRRLLSTNPWEAVRITFLTCSIIAVALGVSGSAMAQIKNSEALVAVVDGSINPATHRFIERAIDEGQSRGVELVVIKLNTSGGDIRSTEKIVETLLSDQIPSVVYVWPRGATASSAGTFIAAAANFSVMAPGTSIGAASPVGTDGRDLPNTLSKKITEAADAMIRSVADVRNRNAEALSATVREASAYSAEEAVKLNVVDFIASDIDDLFDQLDHTSMTIEQEQIILNTNNMMVYRLNMNIIERFIFYLSDPNVAFLLLAFGGMGIVIEFFNPGQIVPGIVGAIFLILAFLALGSLPVNWAGVALILLAMLFLLGELLIAGFGVLGIGAIVSFILGGLILFSPIGFPGTPSTKVSVWVLLLSATIIFAGSGWVMRTIVQSRKNVATQTISALISQIGTVETVLAPLGTVRLANELWTATAEEAAFVDAGERVQVIAIEELTLKVRPLGRGPRTHRRIP